VRPRESKKRCMGFFPRCCSCMQRYSARLSQKLERARSADKRNKVLRRAHIRDAGREDWLMHIAEIAGIGE